MKLRLTPVAGYGPRLGHRCYLVLQNAPPDPSLQRTPQWRVQLLRVCVDRSLVVKPCLLRHR